MAEIQIVTFEIGDPIPVILSREEEGQRKATDYVREQLKQLPGETIVEWHRRLENHPIVVARRAAEQRAYVEHWRNHGAPLPDESIE